MNDKEFDQQVERVKWLADKWIIPLGLGFWKIRIDYSRESKINGVINYTPPSHFGIMFAVSCDYWYRMAQITAYLPNIKDVHDEDLERYFLHELMHIFLNPMQVKNKEGNNVKEEELVATQLADAFLWVLETEKLWRKKV